MCKRSKGAVATIGHKRGLGGATLILEAVFTGLNNLSHLLGHPWPPRGIPVIGIEYGHGLDVLHLNDTHLGQQSGGSLAQ